MHVNYCNPPFAIVGNVITFIATHYPYSRFILIVPFWVAQPWFSTFRNMCSAIFKLPNVRDLVVPIREPVPGPYL